MAHSWMFSSVFTHINKFLSFWIKRNAKLLRFSNKKLLLFCLLLFQINIEKFYSINIFYYLGDYFYFSGSLPSEMLGTHSTSCFIFNFCLYKDRILLYFTSYKILLLPNMNTELDEGTVLPLMEAFLYYSR